MNDAWGKVLRVVAIILMAMTAVMNILGGAGTSCAAFFTKKYPPMWALYDYQWLYQALVVTTIAVGIAGIVFTVGLARGSKNAYRNALIILLIGTLLGGIQYFASLALRGKAVPANIKFYTNVLTLLVFLVIALPGIRQKVNFEKISDSDRGAGTGVATILAGAIVLTTPMWAGPSHMYQGDNWVSLLNIPIIIIGSSLLILGISLLAWTAWKDTQESTLLGLAET